MWSDDVDAERVPGFGVADDLGKAFVFTADERLGDRLERHLADLVGQPPFLALGFGQADRRDLGRQ